MLGTRHLHSLLGSQRSTPNKPHATHRTQEMKHPILKNVETLDWETQSLTSNLISRSSGFGVTLRGRVALHFLNVLNELVDNSRHIKPLAHVVSPRKWV